MKKLAFLTETKRLLDEVYLAEMTHKKKHVLFEVRDWRNVLNLQEIKSLNRAYNKFILQAPILYEGVGQVNAPIQLWENFLILEEEQEKKKGFFSRAWDKVKGAGKAIGSAVGKAYRKVRRGLSSATMGKVFGKGKKGREQEEEFSTQVSTSGVGKVLSGAVPKYWPNNDEFEEFQEDLISAIEKGIEYINGLEKPEEKAEELKNLKKWIVYNADHNLGDRYKHFKGARRKEESIDRMSLKDLIFEEEEKKKSDTIGTSRKESSSWEGLTSNKLIAALVALGFIAGGAAFKLLSDAFQAAQAVATSTPPKEVPQTMTKEITEKVTGKKVDFKFDWWQDGKGGFDRGIDKAMIDAGFSPKNPESVKLFYTTLGEGDPMKGVEKIADSLKKTGKNREIFLAYFKEKVLPSGMAPREMGFSEGKFMGADMSGKPDTPLGVDGIRSSALTGAFTSMVVKKVVSMVLVKAAPAAAKAAGVGAGAAAAVGGAGLAGIAVGALISAGVIKWLRKRSQTESRLAVMMDLLEKVDEMYQKAGGKQEVIEVPPPQDSPNANPEGDDEDEDMSEEEEEASCSPEEVKSKVLEVLKGVKFKKKINIEKVAGKISKILIDKKPKTEEEIVAALGAFRNMGDGLKKKIAAGVDECFLPEDFQEEPEETKPEETKPEETKPEESKPENEQQNTKKLSELLTGRVTYTSKTGQYVVGLAHALKKIGALKGLDIDVELSKPTAKEAFIKSAKLLIEAATAANTAKEILKNSEAANLFLQNLGLSTAEEAEEKTLKAAIGVLKPYIDYQKLGLEGPTEKPAHLRAANSNVKLPEESQQNSSEQKGRKSDSYRREGVIISERWQRLAGIA